MGAAEMTNCLEALEDWVAELLLQLEPSSRNKLARSLAQELRRRQQQRIIAQKNPDGSKYPPRKQRNLRNKQGRMKNNVRMFQKLKTARLLKVQGDANAISTGFIGRVARIARVHQFGLRDRAIEGAPKVKFDQREVLGFTGADLDFLRDGLLTWLD